LRPVSPRLHGKSTAEIIVTNLPSQITLGIDVSKGELVSFCWESEERAEITNQPQAINTWLKSLMGPVRIAIEPTSSYHLEFIDQAHALGFDVYVVNARQLRHYREAVNLRNKTDADDAWLLARYLTHEVGELRRYTPLKGQARTLWTLIKRRAVVVEARKSLQQSLAEVKLAHTALLTQFKAVLARIDLRIKALIKELGWSEAYRHCLSIPGVGPLNAAALVCAFHRGIFAGSDAFIAFIGMDVRVRESGTYKGKRRLTKRGESEIRRLLYCATQPARCEPRFDKYYLSQLDKGLSKTAAKVILARKIARIAFALMTKKQSFKKSVPAY